MQLMILSDYKKGTLAHPAQLIALANQHHVPVLVDPKGIDFSIYQHAAMITPNYKEFEAIVGKCHSEDDILTKGRALLKTYDIQTLLITRGEHGMTLIDAETHLHFPAHAQEVFDVTGAGDTVISTLAAALANHLPLVEATALANLAASVAVRKLGATGVEIAELQQALASQGNYHSAIVNETQLLHIVQTARARGQKIIFTNGCFDILHAGHVTYLQGAKQLGGLLIVGINADESIRALKGPNRPVNSLTHRMTVLASLSAVDYVVAFHDATPERLLHLIRPDYLVKGSDYQLDGIVGKEIVHAYGGQTKIIEHHISLSSTSLLKQQALVENKIQ